MSFDFVIPEINIGGAGTPPLQFFKRGFNLGGSGGSEPSWQDIVLSGNGSLTLTNAKANGLNYLKLFGGCEQNGTPTPTVPVDIVCNNGAIKYSINELNANDIEIGYYRVQATGVLTESPYNFITGFMPVIPNQSYVFFGKRIEDNRLSSYNRIHWFDVNKEFISTNTYTKDTIGTGVAPSNAYFAQCSCNESGSTTRVTTQEVVDGYNWVFQIGTTEVTYIPYVEGGLYIDGTTESINIHGKNYINVANFTIPSNSNYNDVWSGSLTGQFTLSVDTSQVTSVTYRNQRFVALTVNRTISYINYNDCGSIQIDGTLTNISIVGSSGYARAVGKVSLQLEQGTTATTYEPYFNGGTATAEMLLKVGDVKDVQSVLDGVITKNVGILILDGTESWQVAIGTGFKQFYTTNTQGVIANSVSLMSTIAPYGCTASTRADYDYGCYSGGNGNLCFQMIGSSTINTTTDWTNYLSEQYQNNTPVIVVYPLATATTETVESQALTIQAGTNVVEITQASIDNLGLEVSYKGKEGE